MASFTADIPLHCSICPKLPRFSDVSHLLTHIASKGHLSHYYKVQIRAASEDDARQQLAAYNTWYAEWGIENLMSDRMSLKDKRRTRTRAANARRQAANPPQDQLRRKATNALDPQLAQHLVKADPSPTPQATFAVRPYHPPSFAPKMQAWPSPFSTAATYSNPGMDGSDVFTEKTESFSRALTPPAALLSSAHEDNELAGEQPADETTVSEASRLKGVYWPGMDIFDSATPEMKRKRNQKKDVSVVEQLELNSLEVEPTERIWTPLGSLRKEKPISGSVTDSSPIKLDAPSPKRDFLDREALADLNVNQPRHARRPRNANKRSLQSMLDDDEIDLQLTLGSRRRRKRAFEVHKQNDDEVSFGRPASLNMLTAEFQPPPQQAQQTPQMSLAQPQMQQPQQVETHNAFDLRIYQDPFQPQYDGLGFGYQPVPFFDNGLAFPQPFQNAPAQQELPPLPTLYPNFFASSNNTWLDANSFQADEGDFKPQVKDDQDDERTITAPPSEAT